MQIATARLNLIGMDGKLLNETQNVQCNHMFYGNDLWTRTLKAVVNDFSHGMFTILI